MYSGFYKKPLSERHQLLHLTHPHLFNRGGDGYVGDPLAPTEHDREIELKFADSTIENCIGTVGIPLGLAFNFAFNSDNEGEIDTGNHVITKDLPPIPMAIQEPSVVAACSSAAKWIKSLSGGFVVSTTGQRTADKSRPLKLVDGEVLMRFESADMVNRAVQVVSSNASTWTTLANSRYCIRLVEKYGGGVVSIDTRTIPEVSDQLVIVVTVDVVEAMGANIVNSLLEKMSGHFEDVTGGASVMSIISNLSTHCISTSSIRLPIASKEFAYGGVSGVELAKRLMEAYNWARLDPKRRTTHNKGVMNGIDAVAVALGQDWRAVSAACYAFSERKPIVQYWVEQCDIATGKVIRHDTMPEEAKTIKGSKNSSYHLCASISLPLLGVISTQTTLIRSSPLYQLTHGLLSFPTSEHLSHIICSVGLAQNLAALRSLVTEGLQRGHMKLHARSVAAEYGAVGAVGEEVARYMVQCGDVCGESARRYMDAHEIHVRLNYNKRDLEGSGGRPSMLVFDDGGTVFNVAFRTVGGGGAPVVMTLSPRVELDELASTVLGRKSHKWVSSILGILDSSVADAKLLDASTRKSEGTEKLSELMQDLRLNGRALDKSLLRKLKIISILINIILRRMLGSKFHHQTRLFVRDILNNNIKTPLQDSIVTQYLAHGTEGAASSDETWHIALPLLFSLCQTYEFHVDQWSLDMALTESLKVAQRRVIEDLAYSSVDLNLSSSTLLKQGAQQGNNYFSQHARKFHIHLFLLIDCLALDHVQTTAEYLKDVECVGVRLEREVVLAHDFSRSFRDYGVLSKGEDGAIVENSFLAYLLGHVGLATMDGAVRYDESVWRAQILQKYAKQYYELVVASDTDKPMPVRVNEVAMSDVVQKIGRGMKFAGSESC